MTRTRRARTPPAGCAKEVRDACRPIAGVWALAQPLHVVPFPLRYRKPAPEVYGLKSADSSWDFRSTEGGLLAPRFYGGMRGFNLDRCNEELPCFQWVALSLNNQRPGEMAEKINAAVDKAASVAGGGWRYEYNECTCNLVGHYRDVARGVLTPGLLREMDALGQALLRFPHAHLWLGGSAEAFGYGAIETTPGLYNRTLRDLVGYMLNKGIPTATGAPWFDKMEHPRGDSEHFVWSPGNVAIAMEMMTVALCASYAMKPAFEVEEVIAKRCCPPNIPPLDGNANEKVDLATAIWWTDQSARERDLTDRWNAYSASRGWGPDSAAVALDVSMAPVYRSYSCSNREV